MPALVSLVARIPSLTPSLLLELPDPILESANLSLKDVPLSTDGQTKRTPLLVPIVPHLQHETESKIKLLFLAFPIQKPGRVSSMAVLIKHFHRAISAILDRFVNFGTFYKSDEETRRQRQRHQKIAEEGSEQQSQHS